MREQQALRNLFMGAIGTFKNPGSHRMVAWELAEAAEAVYLANTLLRMLGRIEARLNVGAAGAVVPVRASARPAH